MSNVGGEGRSFEQITTHDLLRLKDIALQNRAHFFRKYPQ